VLVTLIENECRDSGGEFEHEKLVSLRFAKLAKFVSMLSYVINVFITLHKSVIRRSIIS
jgi:hypothetical protein